MKFDLNIFKAYHNYIKNPKTRNITVILTIVYFISPIDILPDFIPLLGQVDDTTLFIMLAIELISLTMSRPKVEKKVQEKDYIDVEAKK